MQERSRTAASRGLRRPAAWIYFVGTPLQTASLVLVLAGAVVARFVNLTSFPLFVDEAIYLTWSDSVAHGGSAWISLTDGKQPLPIWVASRLISVGPDPLLALRTMSAVLGTVALFVAVLLFRRFLGGWALVLAVGVYGLSPYTVFHDRLFLYEGFVDLFFLAALFFALRYWSGGHWWNMAVVSAALTAAVWSKTTALLFIAGFLAAAAFAAGRRFFKDRRFYMSVTAIFVIPLATTLLLYLGPSTPGSVQGINGTFQASYWDVLQTPYRWAVPALGAILEYWWYMVGPVAAVVVVVGLLFGGWRERPRAERQVILIVVVSTGLAVTTAVLFFARYYLFTLVPGLIIGLTWAVRVLKFEPSERRVLKRSAAWIGGLAMLAFPAANSTVLLADYTQAWLPPQVRQHHIADWPTLPDSARLREPIKAAFGTRGFNLWTDGAPGLVGAVVPWFRADGQVVTVLPPLPQDIASADALVVQGSTPLAKRPGYEAVDMSTFELKATVERSEGLPVCDAGRCEIAPPLPTSVYLRKTDSAG